MHTNKHTHTHTLTLEKAWETKGATHSSMEFTEDRMLASWSRNAALFIPSADHFILYLYQVMNAAKMHQELLITSVLTMAAVSAPMKH